MSEAKKQRLDELHRVANESAAQGAKGRMQDRMKFLLKQADIFQHFMPAGAAEKARKAGRGRSKSHRQEHAEEEEDAELLKDEDDEGAQG